MSTAIIEINDAGIRTFVDGELKDVSAGYAVLDGNRLLVGEEGRRNARLLPRWTNNRFWSQLGTEPVPGGTSAVRHHADLAFAHLESIWQSLGGADEVVLAVPGFYSREQLGLLLGMAKECDMPVAGVVDTAVAAAAREATAPTVLHLDIFLHRIILTVMNADTSLRRIETVTVSETGLFTLWDRWANIIASQFIQTSRFDPMHQADSEQRLYDALPEWIAARSDSRGSTFELELGSGKHEVAISQEQLLQACSNIYPQIVQLVRDHVPAGESAALLVSDRFRGFPGFSDSLNLIRGANARYLEATHVAEGVSEHASAIIKPGGPVSHTTSLPVSVKSANAPKAPEHRPSHVITGHVARAFGAGLPLSGIENGDFVISRDNPACTIYSRAGEAHLDVAGSGVSLNGKPVTGSTPLALGDVIEIDGEQMTVISASS